MKNIPHLIRLDKITDIYKFLKDTKNIIVTDIKFENNVYYIKYKER